MARRSSVHKSFKCLYFDVYLFNDDLLFLELAQLLLSVQQLNVYHTFAPVHCIAIVKFKDVYDFKQYSI